jgi:glycosyltransferase involved in cell wall biosynthesis
MISIIIICYNIERYIGEAIESTLKQDYADKEIIVVNDGSTDDSIKIIKRYPIKLINISNRGISGARNAGIMNAQGEYLVTLDGDDTLEPNFISETIKLMRPGIGVVYTDSMFFGKENRKTWRTLGRKNAFDKFSLLDLMYVNRVMCCCLVRKEAAIQCGGYNTRLLNGYEDWNFWIDIMKRGWKFVRCPQPLFNYRIRTDSISENNEYWDRDNKLLIMKAHPELYPPDVKW